MKRTVPDYLQEDFNEIYKCNILAEDIISRTDYFTVPTIVESEVLLCDNIQGQLGSALGTLTVLQEQVQTAQEAPAYIASNSREIPLFVKEIENVETKQECKKPRNKLTFYQRAFHSSVIFASSLIIVVFVLTMGVISLNNKKDQWIDKNDQIINTTLTDDEKQYISSNVTRVYDESVFETYICDNTKLSLYKGTNYVDHDKASNVYFYKVASSSKECHKLTIKCKNNTIKISNNNTFGILTTIDTEKSTSFDYFTIEVIDQNGSSRSYQINIPSDL